MDGDPHFVIDFPSSKFSVCFNIDGEPGDILRLVSDHKESGKQPSKAVVCGGELKHKASSLALRLSTKVLHRQGSGRKSEKVAFLARQWKIGAHQFSGSNHLH